VEDSLQQGQKRCASEPIQGQYETILIMKSKITCSTEQHAKRNKANNKPLNDKYFDLNGAVREWIMSASDQFKSALNIAEMCFDGCVDAMIDGKLKKDHWDKVFNSIELLKAQAQLTQNFCTPSE
jgi:hypothetical protein